MKKHAAAIGWLILGTLGAGASAEPFTYQGQLNDGGSPANGLYDMNIVAYDSAVGGSNLSPGESLTNIPVVDGLFVIEVDLGDIFDSGDAWLDISVRSSSGGAFTPLTPRTHITPTPKAQHATTADMAMNAPWTVAPGIISYGDGDDRVFINRDSAITSAEFFGVHGTNSSYNGMYVSGPADSWPFYGYSADGAVSAFHYYNSVSDSWILVSNGSTALVVDAARDLIVTNEVEADNYRYNTPKTHYFSIPGDTFSGGDLEYRVSLGNGGFYTSEAGVAPFTAPVHLPDGAQIVGLRAYVIDNVVGDMSVNISRLTHGGDGFTTVASVSTAGLGSGTYTLEDTTISAGTINNELYHYHIRLYSASWPGNNNMRLKSVRIEYTVDSAD